MADDSIKETPGKGTIAGGGGRKVELDVEALDNINRLGAIMERMRLGEYISMLTRPGKILYINFIAGLARGLGFGLGVTVLLGLSLYIIGRMVDLPLIGSFVAKIVTIVQEEITSVGKSPKF